MTTADAAYAADYDAWRSDPEAYWRHAADAVDWVETPARTFDPDAGPYGRWFPGGRLNITANCLDRHVEAGFGGTTALIWDSPVTGKKQTFSYAELLDLTARFAGALRDVGVGIGDRVLIYMPMIPDAVVAMLATARIGAVHSVVFGGFAPAELAARIADAQPKVIVTASCGIEVDRVIPYLPLVEEARSLSSHAVETCFVSQRDAHRATLDPFRHRDFHEALRAAPAAPVTVAATEPLYILYTSGTTGKPKGIVRDCGGYAVALLRTMETIYRLGRGEVMWTASDIGWVVGHSYIVYAPLLAGCTTILYEGKPIRTPDAGAFWRVCEDYCVTVLFTAPTAIRAIRQQDPDAGLAQSRDLSALAAIFLAGERCDPPTAEWLKTTLGKPVIDHWWQTETGWPVTAGFRAFGLTNLSPGCGGRAVPGWQVAALDEDGGPLPAGDSGSLALRLPLPPGAAPTLWNDDAEFRAAYLDAYPGWYRTGDGGRIDANGDVWIMGRTDDLINVAGHRLSTGAMEEVIAAHPDVAESAVVGLVDTLKGQVPVGLFVLKANTQTPADDVAAALVAMVRDRIGAVAAFKETLAVARLPKTRSGKILRKVIRQIGDGDPVVVPSTIEDAGVVDEIRAALAGRKTTR